MVKTQALITQLVLEHSLRIRINSEGHKTATPTPSQDEAEAFQRPGVEDIAEQDPSRQDEPSTPETANENPDPLADTEEPESRRPQEPQSANLVGKIVNLVTTDLENIGDLRDLLLLLVSMPLQIGLGIVFLYFLLGWRYVIWFLSKTRHEL